MAIKYISPLYMMRKGGNEKRMKHALEEGYTSLLPKDFSSSTIRRCHPIQGKEKDSPMKKRHQLFRSVSMLTGGLCLLVGSLFLNAPAFAQQQPIQVNEKAYLQSMQQYGEQHCLQPPQNVDLMTLSDVQLSLYGLPLRATLDQQPALWEARLSHAKHRACGSSPDPNHFSASPTTTHAPNVTNQTDPHWADNEAYGSRATYKQAGVDFNVPTVTNIHANHYVVVWAGVGGDATVTSPTELVQAGVLVQQNSSGGQSNIAFWQVPPAYSSIQDFNLSRVNAGDSIVVYVSSNLNNDGYDYFFVQDTSGNANDYGSKTLYTDFSDSATGECVVERPTISGDIPNLADFGTEQLSSCDIGSDSSDKGIGSWPHFYIRMEYQGATLATVGSISNTDTFTITWRADI